MLVVDASSLFEVVAATPRADEVRAILREDEEQAAPHLIDAEVLGVIRKHHELGRIDDTAADQAVMDLRDWPGERFGHRSLLGRAWQLRATVRGSDALYVALAEALDAPLLTADARLADAPGPRCEFRLAGPR
jgi:predicted nucleic acid-binding protein